MSVDLCQLAEDGDLGGIEEELNRNPHRLDEMDRTGTTPLMWSASSGQVATAELLVAKGADIEAENNHGNRAIHNACRWGHKNMVEYLTSLNVCLQIKNKNGYTPLFVACINGNYDVVLTLLQNGASVCDIDDRGNTPLVRCGKESNLAMISLLVDYGADINAPNTLKRTLMHKACQLDSEAYIMKLIEFGASLEVMDIRQKTPLDYLPMSDVAARDNKKDNYLAKAKEVYENSEASKNYILK